MTRSRSVTVVIQKSEVWKDSIRRTKVFGFEWKMHLFAGELEKVHDTPPSLDVQNESSLRVWHSDTVRSRSAHKRPTACLSVRSSDSSHYSESRIPEYEI